jgi:general secretion pathway protein H
MRSEAKEKIRTSQVGKVGRDTLGFTLIELLVVLAIMVLVAVLAVPSIFSALPNIEARGGAREVASALREARSRAILSNRDVIFSLDLKRNLFMVSGDKQPHRLSKDLGLSLYTAQQEVVSGNLGSIRFFPDGSSTGGRVGLSSPKKTYNVTVNWVTGKVEIVE